MTLWSVKCTSSGAMRNNILVIIKSSHYILIFISTMKMSAQSYNSLEDMGAKCLKLKNIFILNVALPIYKIIMLVLRQQIQSIHHSTRQLKHQVLSALLCCQYSFFLHLFSNCTNPKLLVLHTYSSHSSLPHLSKFWGGGVY